MSRSQLLPLLLGLLAPLLAPGASAAETITWLYPDFPPYYIVSGPWAGQGTHDERLRLLQDALLGWTHENVAAPSARINRELVSGELVCSMARTRTPEREELFHFSTVPSTLAFPIGLAVRRQAGADLPSEISLARLLAERPDFTLGVAAGRSYGPAVDGVVEPFRGTARLEERAAGDIYGGLVRMLAAGRIDGVLGFPPELSFVGRQQGVEEILVHLPLVESGTFAVGFPVCSDTPAGRAAVRAIEKALRELRPLPPWREAAERWLDAGSMERFRAAYRDLLLAAE